MASDPSPTTYEKKLKFLCSYGGRIIPRPWDRKLRYVGGDTRIIEISNDTSWEEFAQEMMAMCDQPHSIMYQHPDLGEDLQSLPSVPSDKEFVLSLLSVSSDEVLKEMMKYGVVDGGESQKLIRIFLFPSAEPPFLSPEEDYKTHYISAVNGGAVESAESGGYSESEIEELIIDSAVGKIDLGNMQALDGEDVVELQELGSGGFGIVYHGNWKGKDVAIKKIKSSSIAGEQSGQDRRILEFLKEAYILSKLLHQNIVSLYGFILDESRSTVAIVMELVAGGSLRSFLHRENKYLDYRKRLLIARGAALGMEFLHLKNVIHFDLKCENLLVDLKDPDQPICKVTDFGLSKVRQNTLVSAGIRGTVPWMAPELFKEGKSMVSEKVDVFSFGIVMWEILTGKVPYANMDEGQILGGRFRDKLRPPVPKSCPQAWRRLMEECWASDPQQRPSFTQIACRLNLLLLASHAESGK